jgi:ABC-type sugar transport system permease subunit
MPTRSRALPGSRPRRMAGRLLRITLPNIVPMLGTVTTLMTAFSFNAFGIIYAMTRGGPVLVYKQSFLDQD